MALMSSLTASIDLILSVPVSSFLSALSSASIRLPILYQAFFLSTNHLRLASRTFSTNRPTYAALLMYSFLILSPNETSTLPPPAPPPVFSTVPPSPVRATLLVSSCTPSLSLYPVNPTSLSQITPDILLHPFHPACTLFFTYLPHSQLLCTVDPRYLKSSSFATSYPCILTVPLSWLSFFSLLTFFPRLSSPDLQLSSFYSTCFLLSLQITMFRPHMKRFNLKPN